MEESDSNVNDDFDGLKPEERKDPNMNYEPRGFMFCNFLNHSGLASI